MEKPKRAPSAKAQRRRAEIMEIALSMFAERGYEGASIRDLSNALGINEAGIYYYFASKDALYGAVISEHIFRLDPSSGFDAGELQAWLQAVAVRFLAILTQHRRVTSIIIAETFKPRASQHPAIAAFRDEIRTRRTALEQCLADAGRRDADWLAQRFFGGIFGAWALEAGFGDPPWSDAQIDAFAKRFVRGLLAVDMTDQAAP